MPEDAVYREKIAQYEQAELLALWEAIEAGDTPDWEPGKAFEYFILRAFELEGAEVCYPYRVSIEKELEQIDGVIYADGIACLIEVKDQQEHVNFEPVAKLRSQLLRRPAMVIGSVFSRSGFTYSCITLTKYTAPQTILLWNGKEIDYAFKNHSMRWALKTKYHYCVEYGLFTYNLLEETLL
jgi:hypothetical protein